MMKYPVRHMIISNRRDLPEEGGYMVLYTPILVWEETIFLH